MCIVLQVVMFITLLTHKWKGILSFYKEKNYSILFFYMKKKNKKDNLSILEFQNFPLKKPQNNLKNHHFEPNRNMTWVESLHP